MRSFNTTGLCIPCKHYMVSTESRVRKMRLYAFFVGESETDPGLSIAAGVERVQLGQRVLFEGTV